MTKALYSALKCLRSELLSITNEENCGPCFLYREIVQHVQKAGGLNGIAAILAPFYSPQVM